MAQDNDTVTAKPISQLPEFSGTPDQLVIPGVHSGATHKANLGTLISQALASDTTKANKTEVDTKFTQLSSQVGDLSNLNTDDVSSLVNAINEVLSKIGSGGSGSGSSSGGGSVQVINNLSSTSTTAALSAAQGNQLYRLFGNLDFAIGDMNDLSNNMFYDVNSIVEALNKVRTIIDGMSAEDNLTSDSTTKPLSAKQGKALKDLIDDIYGKLGDLDDTPVADAIGAINDTIGDAESMIEAHGSIVGAIDSVEGRVASLEQNGGGSSSGGGSASGTTTIVNATSYNDLNDKPCINGHELSGNLTARQLGIITESDQSVSIAQRYLDAESVTSNRALLKTGAITSSTTTGANVKLFDISEYTSIYVSGFSPSTSGSNALACFYDENDTFISYTNPSNSAAVSNKLYSVPSNAKYIRVFGNNTKQPNVLVYYNAVEESGALEVLDKLNGRIVPTNTQSGVAISTEDGSIVESDFNLAHVCTFQVSGGGYYKASGRGTETPASTCFLAWFNGDTFISAYTPRISRSITNEIVVAPKNATAVKIWGADWSQAALYEYENEQAPQVSNIGYFVPRSTETPLKVLFFGSSWFMDTWIYMNKITANAGINCEITSYYMGHCQFYEWIDMYNGVALTDTDRSFSKYVSSNGSTWTISEFTLDEYAADFKSALQSADWDLICFQQGAKDSPTWAAWTYYEELVKIVKRNCKPTTKICFNSTWCMAKQQAVGQYTSYYANSRDGQMAFQLNNWECTKRFMRLSGIYDVAPNGALLWQMRQDSSLNTTTDMADDGIHPNNGLPAFAVNLCFFDTFIAPIYGKSAEDVTILPTSSWKKASVSGTSWTPMTTTQLARIKKHIRLAHANRFGFNTLED